MSTMLATAVWDPRDPLPQLLELLYAVPVQETLLAAPKAVALIVNTPTPPLAAIDALPLEVLVKRTV